MTIQNSRIMSDKEIEIFERFESALDMFLTTYDELQGAVYDNDGLELFDKMNLTRICLEHLSGVTAKTTH